MRSPALWSCRPLSKAGKETLHQTPCPTETSFLFAQSPQHGAHGVVAVFSSHFEKKKKCPSCDQPRSLGKQDHNVGFLFCDVCKAHWFRSLHA